MTIAWQEGYPLLGSSPKQYLVRWDLELRDGTIDELKGPVFIWQYPWSQESLKQGWPYPDEKLPRQFDGTWKPTAYMAYSDICTESMI